MRIELVVGDWSKDGHGISETFLFEVNLNKEQIYKAYKKGSKILGYDLIETKCRGYEESSVTELWWKEFLEATKTKDEDYTVDGAYNGNISIYPETWAQMYWAVCKLGDESLTYEEVENDGRIEINGYGLCNL